MILELLSESAMRKATTTATPENVKTQENQPVTKHVEIPT